MSDQSSSAQIPIDWGIASQALPGQVVSGDRHLVKPFPNGVLVGVVDGLGHGEEAAAAAEIAIATLEAFAYEPLILLVGRCHRELMRTRGVALALASLNTQEKAMTWLSVGNVEGLLLRADGNAPPPHESVLLRGGVVGYQLPPLHAAVLPVAHGDTLIFATDGIDSGFGQGVSRSDPPQKVADAILAQHAKETDDALVLVARYWGAKS